MWAATPTPLSRPASPSHVTVLAGKSHPRGHRSVRPKTPTVTSESIGGLGQSLLTAVNSDSNTQKQNQKQGTNKEKNQISGSDVLWALQRAASQQKNASTQKKKKITKEASATAKDKKEEDIVDYSNLRPLQIKSEWSIKLDEFENRLKELEATV